MSTTTSGWVGWGVFAGVILVVSGIFNALQGVVALVGPSTYFAETEGGLFLFDLTGWGWWHLIVGILLFITAVALLAGAVWARIVAIILAIISASGQLFLIPVQPWWALVVIAVDILIIYALTAHGDELREQR